MTKIFRKGATGALLDIYEQAISDLKEVVKTIPDNSLTVITDTVTTDENCRSIQAILSHVVHAAYGYAASIHHLKVPGVVRKSKVFHLTTKKEYLDDLAEAFGYTENIFRGIKDDELEENDDSLKIKSGWGQSYDIEQITEHAIVHILRHKRQIEKIIQSKLHEDWTWQA